MRTYKVASIFQACVLGLVCIQAYSSVTTEERERILDALRSQMRTAERCEKEFDSSGADLTLPHSLSILAQKFEASSEPLPTDDLAIAIKLGQECSKEDEPDIQQLQLFLIPGFLHRYEGESSNLIVEFVETVISRAYEDLPQALVKQILTYENRKDRCQEWASVRFLALAVLARQSTPKSFAVLKELVLEHCSLCNPHREDMGVEAINALFWAPPRLARDAGREILKELSTDSARVGECLGYLHFLTEYEISEDGSKLVALHGPPLEDRPRGYLRTQAMERKRERLGVYGALFDYVEDEKHRPGSRWPDVTVNEETSIPAHLEEKARILVEKELNSGSPNWERLEVGLRAATLIRGELVELADAALRVLESSDSGDKLCDYVVVLFTAITAVACQNPEGAQDILFECATWQYWHKLHETWDYDWPIRALMQSTLSTIGALPNQEALPILKNVAEHYADSENADEQLRRDVEVLIEEAQSEE